MTLSLIGRSLKQSATLKLNETAAILKAKGEPIIHLGGGEPKGKAPLDAITRAAAMLNSAEVRYSPPDGTVEAKQAVIRYTEEHYGIRPRPENVIVSVGAKQALFFAMQAILNPQDEVLFPSPYWVSYKEMAKMIGAVGISVEAEDGGFHPTMKDLTAKVGSQTKAIIINSPNNPTGVMYTAEFIAEIVEFCRNKGIYLIMDDIYHRLLFDNKKTISVFNYAKFDDDSKVIVINGVSKLYAMTGFRVGWAIANPKVIEVMTNIQAHTNSAPSPLLQAAAAGALNGIQSSVESLKQTLENNRNVMYDRLKAFEGVRLTKPDGTFYMFVDFRAYEKDSVKLATLLLDKVRVAVMPGIEFGMEGYVRMSYNTTTKEILQGIERIKWALDPNAPNELYIGERKLVRDWV
ncbi:MAG TPA: pyridoxal phosphate-dependent aminotransferase [Bacteroidales bacterium]|nr:pyridoxal phosphate-dependent aminotransferase [Bacteroidales bacterium]